jgi:hypothetical protein
MAWKAVYGMGGDEVDGGSQVLERLDHVGPALGVADIEHGDPEHALALQLRRNEWLGRRGEHDAAGGELVRGGVGPVAPVSQNS